MTSAPRMAIAAAFAITVCLTNQAVAQDCSAAVNAALADGSLDVVSVTPEGVQMILQGTLKGETDPARLRALLDNVECALAGPGGRLKRLELLSPDRKIVARKIGGTIDLPRNGGQ